MPDTKSGREKKGRNKKAQLEEKLNRQEVGAEGEEEPPRFEDVDDDLLAEPSETERHGD